MNVVTSSGALAMKLEPKDVRLPLGSSRIYKSIESIASRIQQNKSHGSSGYIRVS